MKSTLMFKASLGLLLVVAASTASAGVVVVVSAKSDVTKLDKAQVSQLFLNKASSFPGGGTAAPVDQAAGAGRNEFYTKVASKDAAQMKAYWAQLTFTGKGTQPKQLGSGGDVKKFVAGSTSAIGYIDAGEVDASVRVVLTP